MSSDQKSDQEKIEYDPGIHQENMGSAIEYRMPAPLKLNSGTDLLPEWLRFKQQMDIFLTAAGFDRVSESRKAAIFLNCVGPEAQDLYFNVLKTGENAKYEQIIRLFDDHFEPKQNEVMNAYIFNRRRQEEGESFDLFYMDLKKLIKNCNYKELQDRMIRDRIVMGVLDKKLQQKLLAVSDLTLEKAVDISRASEMSKAQAKVMQQQEQGAVDVVRRQYQEPDQTQKRDKYYTNKRQSRDFYHCKKCDTQHGPRSCPAYGKYCSNCNKPNHFRKGCKFLHNIVSDNNEDKNNHVHDL